MYATCGRSAYFIKQQPFYLETTSASAAGLAKAGVTKAMAPYKASGVVYFFNAKTKKPLTQITVANTNDEIAMVMSMLLKQK